MNAKIIFQSERYADTPSTLLIPEGMLDLLDEKIAQYGSIAGFLHHAVRFINPVFYDYRPRQGTGKTRFQPRTTKLVKINFRPFAEDWEVLRMHAFSFRVSMILLFLVLLMSKECFEGEGERVPTTLTKYSLKQTIFVNVFTFITLERLIL